MARLTRYKTKDGKIVVGKNPAEPEPPKTVSDLVEKLKGKKPLKKTDSDNSA